MATLLGWNARGERLFLEGFFDEESMTKTINARDYYTPLHYYKTDREPKGYTIAPYTLISVERKRKNRFPDRLPRVFFHRLGVISYLDL